MKNQEAKVGYLRNGQKVDIVGEHNNLLLIKRGIMVSEYCEDEYGHGGYEDVPTFGKIEAIGKSQVYAKPPTAMLEKRCEDLKAKEFDLSTSILHKEGQVKRLKEERTSIIQRNQETLRQIDAIQSKYEALKRLDDIMSGKVTHYIRVSDSVPEVHSIESLHEKLDYREQSQCQFRLLTLWGKSNGDMLWKVNRYRDGSGSYTLIELFSCHEDALNRSIELLLENVESRGANKHYIHYAKKVGIDLPKEKLVEYHESIQANLTQLYQTAQDEAERLEKELLEADKYLAIMRLPEIDIPDLHNPK